MLEDIKKLSKTRFKRTNFKAFSFFLVFSLLIWMLVQFSRTYQEIVRVPIDYVEIPKDKIISDEKMFLELKIKENGFRIAWFSIFKNHLKVNLSDMEGKGDSLVYKVGSNAKNILRQLEISAEDVVFLDETITIGYQQKAVKTVPIRSEIQLLFLPGYAASDSLELTPDSIKISGPLKRLNSIKMIKTEPLTLEKLDGPVSGKVGIDTIGLGQITFYKNQVHYSLKVEKFTEGTLEVPMSVINAPTNMEIVLFPKTLKVIFKVSLQNYNEISTNDFRIVCDYNELEEGQQFFIPKVLKRPEAITHLRLGINKVKFIIKK